jgi:hypothetical protein
VSLRLFGRLFPLHSHDRRSLTIRFPLTAQCIIPVVANGCEGQHQNGFAGPACAREAVGHECGTDQENVNQIDPPGLACAVVSVEAIQVIHGDQRTQNRDDRKGNPIVSRAGADQEECGAQNEQVNQMNSGAVHLYCGAG